MNTAIQCHYGAAIDGRTHKVAAVTGLFWRLRILAAALGKTSGDMMSMTLGFGYLGSLFITAAFLSSMLFISLGDFFSDRAGLGYLAASAITVLVVAVVYLLHRSARLPSMLAFRAAFVRTRPFGATFGDLLTKPTAHNGLGRVAVSR